MTVVQPGVHSNPFHVFTLSYDARVGRRQDVERTRSSMPALTGAAVVMVATTMIVLRHSTATKPA